MKLRSVSLLLLGQMFWLTAACTSVSTHRPADNWASPAVPAALKHASSKVQIRSEANPVDENLKASREVALESAMPSQRAYWPEPYKGAQAAKRTSAPAMMMGVRETAPEGLRDFCRRQPQQCNIKVVSRAPPERHQDGFRLTGLGPDLSDIAPSRAIPPASALPIRAFAATREDLAQINQINRQINRAMIGVTDQIAFGRTEFWTMPLSAPEYSSLRTRPLADCEDFALEKRRALIAAGIPETALYLAVAVSPRTSLHAVLVVATVQGDLVLDNLNDWVVGYQETGYTWVKRQSTTSLLDWADAVQFGAPNARMFTNLETRVPTLRRESEAQSPTIALASAWEPSADGTDLSEPVVLSIRATGGRSR